MRPRTSASASAPPATGLLQATLGNLPELFVVVFALRAGERVVAQSAIVGSLFATALLDSRPRPPRRLAALASGVMHFDPKVARDASTLMLACVFIIVIVGLSLSSGARGRPPRQAVSIVAAALLLTVYVAWVVPYVRRGVAPRPAEPRIALRNALVLLVLAGVGAGFVSDWFVDALRPSIHTLHISPAFAGLVIVAIAGNAVEQGVGVVLAARGKADLAISVVVNSVAQIAGVPLPGARADLARTGTALTFALPPIYIGALAITAIVVWQVTDDGEGHPYEGWALVATYAVLAIITLYE